VTGILGEELGPVIVPYRTVIVPPNNGTWVICSDVNTDYVSYSVRVTSDRSISLDKSCGQSYLGLPSSTFKNIRGVTAAVISHSDVNLFTSHKLDFTFVPSLSCIYSVVLTCDQDTGNIFIDQPDKYCLGVTNPTGIEQKVKVAVDFKNTVFSKGGFTSPNQPGGNPGIIVQEDDTNSSQDIISKDSSSDVLMMQKGDIRNAASLVWVNGMMMNVAIAMVVILGLL
ncbi:10797_t:CDS:2, partial [Acaulospora morrowiae]